MKKKVIISIMCTVPVVICMIVIFLFSAQPSTKSTETSSGFAEILADIVTPNFDTLSSEVKKELTDSYQFAVRKTAHFGIYAILGIFSYISVCTLGSLKTNLKFIIPALFCLAYAISDELHQYFVPGRSCQISDVLLDIAGAVAGISFIMGIHHLLKKHRKKHTHQ